MSVEFSAEAKKEFENILSKYPEKRAALLPTLHLAQREFEWLSPDVFKYISELLDIPVGEVYDTASFYTMFKIKPTGKYLIQVCSTLSCYLRGSKDIVAHLKEKYGLEPGQTTEDGKFTLWKVECLGSCGTAPVVQINDDYYEDMTIEKLDEVLTNLEKK
ncbi:MAG: NADH-quinone oxidoreductase subunit NuoE [Calditrichia bacterium]